MGEDAMDVALEEKEEGEEVEELGASTATTGSTTGPGRRTRTTIGSSISVRHEVDVINKREEEYAEEALLECKRLPSTPRSPSGRLGCGGVSSGGGVQYPPGTAALLAARERQRRAADREEKRAAAVRGRQEQQAAAERQHAWRAGCTDAAILRARALTGVRRVHQGRKVGAERSLRHQEARERYWVHERAAAEWAVEAVKCKQDKLVASTAATVRRSQEHEKHLHAMRCHRSFLETTAASHSATLEKRTAHASLCLSQHQLTLHGISARHSASSQHVAHRERAADAKAAGAARTAADAASARADTLQSRSLLAAASASREAAEAALDSLPPPPRPGTASSSSPPARTQQKQLISDHQYRSLSTTRYSEAEAVATIAFNATCHAGYLPTEYFKTKASRSTWK